ncbi:Rieske 2Fe-2S domain-containing protein [Jatrophihabitans sp. DSM 45814]
MGANIRFHEWRTERQIRAGATRGIRPPKVNPLDETLNPLPADGETVKDRRQLVPALGLREYWWPALPTSKVPTKGSIYWKMLGEELAFFRNKDGSVAAVSDVCPHRGASLSRGHTFYPGTLSCPYHGATFDGKGECKAFITEGPASKMVGDLKVRSYPTQELKGWVFVWMGKEAPAPIEQDVPPEFFEPDSTLILTTYTYWKSSWILAIENQDDPHNSLYAHRNSLMQLMSPRFRARTPTGPRAKLVEDRALVILNLNQKYYADENGKVPYQMYYPGVDGVWPLSLWRQRIWKLFSPWYKYIVWRPSRLNRRFEVEAEEWGAGRGSSWHLPAIVRRNFNTYMFSRWAVPVDAELSRIVYMHARRTSQPGTQTALKIWWRLYYNWWNYYNFSGADDKVASPSRYWTPESLSATDSHLVMLRRLITERSRDAKLRFARGQKPENANKVTTPGEQDGVERQVGVGMQPPDDLLDDLPTFEGGRTTALPMFISDANK